MKRSLKLFAAITLFSGLCCFYQCRKDKPKTDNPYGLPNATQWGAGVFACLINGQKFVAGRTYLTDGARVIGDTLYIRAILATASNFQLMGIYVKQFLQGKRDYVIDGVNVGVEFMTDSTCQGLTGTRSFSKARNLVITKLDTARRIVSGTFDGLTFATPGCDTLHVTNGRFDYYYYYH